MEKQRFRMIERQESTQSWQNRAVRVCTGVDKLWTKANNTNWFPLLFLLKIWDGPNDLWTKTSVIAKASHFHKNVWKEKAADGESKWCTAMCNDKREEVELERAIASVCHLAVSRLCIYYLFVLSSSARAACDEVSFIIFPRLLLITFTTHTLLFFHA